MLDLESFDVNRSVTFVRNPDYWGWDLPINKGNTYTTLLFWDKDFGENSGKPPNTTT